MSVSRTRAETRAFWQHMVDAWRDSGLSKAAFCRQSDIHPASFSPWSRRLAPSSVRERSAPTPSVPATALTMIPVSVIDEPDSVSVPSSSNSVSVSRCDITVTLPAVMDAELINTWLHSIASLDVQR